MTFSSRYAAPRPQLYDIYFEKERNVRFLESYQILPIGDVSHYDGHACTTALLTSGQRADLSKHASLRPIGNQ